MIGVLCVLAGFGGEVPSVEELRELVSDRSARLHRLVVELEHTVYTVPMGSSPFDRARWKRIEAFPYRILLVRPNLLAEYLKDDPEHGYVPVVASVHDGTYTSRHVRPNRFGQTTFVHAAHEVQAGVFTATPLLQVMDIHFQDCTISQLNVLRLFEERDVEVVRAAAGIVTCVAAVPMPGYVAHYEFDLNERGSPVRLRTVLEYDDKQLLPATWEQSTIATEEVNGAEFPTETVVTIHNPNVTNEYIGLHHLLTKSVRVDEGLTAESTRIELVPRNSTISEFRGDGSNVIRYYDSNGNVTRTQELLAGPAPIDPSVRYVPRDSLRWRMAIPPICLALGLGVGLAFAYVSRHRPAGAG